MALHFDQSAVGSLKFESETFTGIYLVERARGRDDQLDVAIVEFVHQCNEATRGVGLGAAHRAEPRHQHRIEIASHLNVVDRAAGFFTEFLEAHP